MYTAIGKDILHDPCHISESKSATPAVAPSKTGLVNNTKSSKRRSNPTDDKADDKDIRPAPGDPKSLVPLLRKSKVYDDSRKANSNEPHGPRHMESAKPAAAPSTTKGSKKRVSHTEEEADDKGISAAPGGPKAPVPPLKKSRININDDPRKAIFSKPHGPHLTRESESAKPAAAPSKTAVASKGSKKRSSLTDNEADNEGIGPAPASGQPKTPVPPLKKPRVSKNENALKDKPQPLRRTGAVTFIFKLKC